eukprot:10449785-Prorocentrum_lima.AAC.1
MGMPFIIAGDFNFPPEVLVGHPLLAALDAVVVAPALPTCHNGERVLDFAIMSAAVDVVGVEVLLDAPVAPHRPVVVKVAGLVKCLARGYPVPRAFPVVVPQGCSREGVGQVWEKAK